MPRWNNLHRYQDVREMESQLDSSKRPVQVRLSRRGIVRSFRTRDEFFAFFESDISYVVQREWYDQTKLLREKQYLRVSCGFHVYRWEWVVIPAMKEEKCAFLLPKWLVVYFWSRVAITLNTLQCSETVCNSKNGMKGSKWNSGSWSSGAMDCDMTAEVIVCTAIKYTYLMQPKRHHHGQEELI